MDNLDSENPRERFLVKQSGSFISDVFFCDVFNVIHGTANPDMKPGRGIRLLDLGMLSGTQDSESKCLRAEEKCRGQKVLLAMDVWSIGM